MTNYSQVIYLDKTLTKKVKNIQKKIFDLTWSKACLEIWEPHLTIGDGIIIDDKNIDLYCEKVKKLLEIHNIFEIEVKNYNFMDNWSGWNLPGHSKYVIYLNIILNKEIKNLAKSIKDDITKVHPIWYKQTLP